MNKRYPAENKQYENDYYGKGWETVFHIKSFNIRTITFNLSQKLTKIDI